MTKGLTRTLSRNPARQAILKKTFKLSALALSVAGTSGVGFGSAVLGDLPEGNILIMGAVAYMQFTTADGDVQATFDGDYSVGSAATADATLNGAEVDIIPSTSFGGAATAGVSPLARGAQPAQTILDNTDGSLELNLNVLIDDANISGTGDFTVTGVLYLVYSILGDD